jgi:DNA primase
MFDNDFAGRAAAQRFNKNINKNIFVTNLYFGNLKKKDINDLTKDEFDQILNAEGLTFRLKALP